MKWCCFDRLMDLLYSLFVVVWGVWVCFGVLVCVCVWCSMRFFVIWIMIVVFCS